MSKVFGGGPAIKSIQTGTVTIANAAASGTATITGVDVANSLLIFDGDISTNAGGAQSNWLVRLTLTNSTTVTADRVGTTSISTVRFTIIEFHPGHFKSVQYGTIALAAVTSNTAAINAVDTTKAVVFFLGFSSNGTGGVLGTTARLDVALTNATTVTATRTTGTDTYTISFVVVEWYV